MKARLLALLLAALTLCGCAAKTAAPDAAEPEPVRRMELRYAEQFTVDYRADGCALVTIGGGERYLVVPEGVEAPEGGDAAVLREPLAPVYLASSSAMDLFTRLDALDRIRLTSTKAEDWALPEIRRLMDGGAVRYAGKYSAPDYELLLNEGVRLAIENTMIYHSPDTKEQLEALGIPVLVERSSYETHPLGRLEWIKLYGLLVGREAEAAAFFDEQAALAEALPVERDTGKTAAFFYISANGYVNVRRPNDYIPKMIELAGGRYALKDALAEDDGARSTMNMQVEAFCAAAKDADVLIYNATVSGGMETLEQLLAAGGWLSDFAAVRSHSVWCTEMNVFQQTSGIAEMIAELNAILGGTAEGTSLKYFHALR